MGLVADVKKRNIHSQKEFETLNLSELLKKVYGEMKFDRTIVLPPFVSEALRKWNESENDEEVKYDNKRKIKRNFRKNS